jgi:serine/threonine protein phosphatase PrpC
MKIDSFLKIGHSHEQCQDYILTGSDPCPYIILADGCSQAKDSDIGARLLCHTALKYLKKNQSRLDRLDPPEKVGQDIIVDAAFALKVHFNTRIDCLDATLIFAYKFKKYYHIYMYGDGVVLRVNHDDNINFTRAHYKPNAPGYLRYRIDGYEKYQNSHVVKLTDTHVGVHSYDSMEPWHHIIHEDDVKTLLIASDGIESFIYNDQVIYKTLYNALRHVVLNDSPRGSITEMPKIIEDTLNPEIKELDWYDVVGEMIYFKNTNGVFLKRRVKKVMKNYLKKGFINDDDLSMGCFYEEK